MAGSPIEDWPRSQEHGERARATLGLGVSSGMRAQFKPHPLFFDRGAGSRLTDVDGNEYVDYVLGWGPALTGHAHPHVVERVREQAGRGQAFGSATVAEYTLAERVTALVPGMDQALWSNTGTEANLQALRLARARTGRSRFVKFRGHYHGWSDPMLVGYRPGPDGDLDGPGSRGQEQRDDASPLLADWNDLDSVRAALAGGEVAAVFCEPVLCNSGVIPPAPGFLEGLREACDAAGSLLVFDEVITGFRIAPGGGTQRFGVTPDLVVHAKAIASGYPLAAVLGGADLIGEVGRGVAHAGTYNGNAMVIAAAHATLDVLAQPGTYERLDAHTDALATGLTEAAERAGRSLHGNKVTGVVQVALSDRPITGLDDYLRADWAEYDRVAVELRRRGVFVLPGGRWYLSTSHTQDDIAATLAAFGEALGRR